VSKLCFSIDYEEKTVNNLATYFFHDLDHMISLFILLNK